jgi:hypothetical protein
MQPTLNVNRKNVMNNRFVFLGIAMAGLLGSSIPTYATTTNIAPVPATSHTIVLAQLTPQQAQCQQEAAQLSQQLSQCTTSACRQQIQAAIASHNARCSNAR